MADSLRGGWLVRLGALIAGGGVAAGASASPGLTCCRSIAGWCGSARIGGRRGGLLGERDSWQAEYDQQRRDNP